MIDILQIILLTVGTMLDKSDCTVVTLYLTTLKLKFATMFYQNNLFNNITAFASLNFLSNCSQIDCNTI